jgi:hypothetical protein
MKPLFWLKRVLWTMLVGGTLAGRGGGGSQYAVQQSYLYQRDRLSPLYRHVEATEATKDRTALQLFNWVYQPGGRFLKKVQIQPTALRIMSHEQAVHAARQASLARGPQRTIRIAQLPLLGAGCAQACK